MVEGDYLIVYSGKAMKAAVSSNRLGYVGVTDNGKRIENSDESIIWHIAPSAEYWTIFNDNTKSFAASNGTKNQAQLLADGTDARSLWTVTKTNNAATFEFVNKANTTAKVNANLRNNGTYGFACYAAATGGPLSLYRLGGSVDNTVPTLSIDQTSKTWAADATDAFVVNVTVNSEGGDWTVTPETLSWATIAVDKTAGTITVTPNGANETETANEATLTVTHASDASLTKEISLKQNGKGEVLPISFSITNKTVKSGTITFTAATGEGSSAPAVNSSLLRLYAKNTITIEDSAKPISKIEIVFTKQGNKTYNTTLTADSGTVVSGGASTSGEKPVTDTWTSSTTPTKKVVFTLGTSGQRVIKSVKVYF